jgi:hypothetical protein
MSLCLFPYDPDARIVKEDRFQEAYPLAHEYLQAHRSRLAQRRLGKGQPWYALASSDTLKGLSRPKVMVAAINSGSGFAIDDGASLLCGKTVITLVPGAQAPNLYFLLGVLNSCIFRRFARSRMPTLGEGRREYRIGHLRDFPLALPDSGNAAPLGKQIAACARELHTGKLGGQRAAELRQTIDQKVAQLYGIPEHFRCLLTS